MTASIDRVDFHAPVFVGEVVEFRARTVRRGRTSVTVEVVVDSERLDGAWARVTEAKLTLVAVDEHGKSIPFGGARPAGERERWRVRWREEGDKEEREGGRGNERE